MKYFIEDTTLTDIADAVREKEESTQRIPVVELADRIRDIRSGAEIGVTLNDDGTQNLFITETGDLPDLAAVTADADAEAEDVLYGKTFYAMGVKKVGSLELKADLLWEDESFAWSSDIALDLAAYSYIIMRFLVHDGASDELYAYALFKIGESGQTAGGYVSTGSAYGKVFNVTTEGVFAVKPTAKNIVIPREIWGINFTL